MSIACVMTFPQKYFQYFFVNPLDKHSQVWYNKNVISWETTK